MKVIHLTTAALAVAALATSASAERAAPAGLEIAPEAIADTTGPGNPGCAWVILAGEYVCIPRGGASNFTIRRW